VLDQALTFERLLAVAQEREDVLGLFLFGSRGRQYMVDASSDWDVCVVVADEAARKRFDGEYPYVHGAQVEISSTTIEELRVAGVVGTATEQARYAAAHVDVLIDKTGGEMAKIVASKEWIPPADRDRLIRDALDSYINSTYRSLRYGTRLDAVESLPPALRTIFGLAGRPTIQQVPGVGAAQSPARRLGRRRASGAPRFRHRSGTESSA
jgi:predicted nucleotidyltransferase